MYVTSQRLSTHNGYQLTRSWRTGRRYPGEGPYREVVSQPPKPTGNVGHDIAARNKYYEEIAENLFSQPSYSGHSLVGDSGHEFHTVTLGGSPGLFKVYQYGKLIQSGKAVPRVFVSARDMAFLQGRPMYGALRERAGYVSQLPAAQALYAQQSAKVGTTITDMVPDHGDMGWGETLFELARGNFPRAVSDLRKRIAKGRVLDPKGMGRDLGSEYLNAQFGIVPIVSDTIKLIEHLQKVSGLLYDGFYRKRSTYPDFDKSAVQNTVVGWDPRMDSGYIRSIRSSEYRVEMYSDTRVRAKFSKAQPGIAGNRFADEAFGYLRTLGFNEKLGWDLVPFSWLLDWSGHIGSSIENAAAFAPSTGRYLSQYMWATRKFTAHAVAPRFSHFDSVVRTDVSSSSAFIKVLDRTPVSPYGVKSALSSLTPYQWSILVALGFAFKR